MANLRVIGINAADSRTVLAKFTEALYQGLTTENVVIESQTVGVPDTAVLGILINKDILAITVRPLTPMARYRVTFQSTDSIRFRNETGTSFLFEDGKTNVIDIIGAEDPDNTVRDNLVSYLQNNIYDLNRGTFIRDVLNQISTMQLRALHDIGQARNDNYLSVLIENEQKARGFGPWDRLSEEGAYEVVRVGFTEQEANLDGEIRFDSFPYDPVSLQQVTVSREILTAAISGLSTFDALILTVQKSPVIRLNSVRIEYQIGGSYEYDISTLGYQINDPKYDTATASTLKTLEDNQFKLNEEIYDDPAFQNPAAGDNIIVSYDFKNLGRVVDKDTVTVTQTLNAVREAAPPLITSFSLDHAPVVTSSGAIATSNGIQFLDPASATPFLTTHPAFTTEIPFRYSNLPKSAGEFSVDYETGRVFVWGAETNDGTGNFPPGMTYNYRYSFVELLDYTYEPDGMDLVASPLRDLTGQTAKISYSYEQALIPGIDYDTGIHTESLNERIENRLATTGSLQTLHAPITNVFRIFNETTSEVYVPTRFSNNTVHFTYTTPPSIRSTQAERANFADVVNETLIVSTEITNVLGTRVFKIPLVNSVIMGSTDDVVGSSFNTSVMFSRSAIFDVELYYDNILDVNLNINRLQTGQYQIDYRNGIVYVGVESTQTTDVGTITYQKDTIAPNFSHVMSVSDIYYSLSLVLGATTKLNYNSFSEGEIVPTTLDYANERFLNNDPTLPYYIVDNTIEVTDDVKEVRHIFDAYDLNNNVVPTDFGEGATADGNIITLDENGADKQDTGVVVSAILTVTVPTISPGIEIGEAFSVVRLSDGAELLDGYETILGNTISLSPTSGAIPGDVVDIVYTVILNGASTPIVDYDRGGFYIDYTYLFDEILVSYEYGDNVIDFRQTDSMDEGDNYFVTYRVGALRDALDANFASIIDIPELKVFDTDLDREVYRDVLTGALQSFLKGPTIPSIKGIVSAVTKIEPEIKESAFEVWSLGVSRLFQQSVNITGDPQLVAAKFDQGVKMENAGDTISFPVSSNLRLEEGTLETWFTPDWDGLDNDATLTFSLLKKNGQVLSANSIYIGSTSFNPTVSGGVFTVNRMDDPSPIGLPSAVYSKTGLFIYYDEDVKRWKVLAKDIPQDGYDGYVYTGTIVSSGEVYDVKFVPGLGEIDDVVRSGNGSIDFEFRLNFRDKASPDGYVPGYSFDGIMFMADDVHYIFDFAETESTNRFSLYKDGRGYLAFSVWDRGNGYYQKPDRKNVYTISADIQDWLAGRPHHIGLSWILNSQDRRDEMHLYIDGLEVPNIIKYGGIPPAVSTDRFRTVATELVVGTVPKTVITNDDLITAQGTSVVTSASINFTTAGIVPGDTFKILEIGFTTYTILAVSGNSLELDANMPATLTDARFSVNPYSMIVETEINTYNNITVSILYGGIETEIPGVRAEIPGYSITQNALNQDVLTLLGDASAGSQVIIRSLGLNHRRCRERIYIWGDTQSILKTAFPPPIDLDKVSIRAVLRPYLVIGPSNSTLVGGNFVATGISASQPTNSTEGRHIEVRVTGGNVDFSTATTVTIHGTSDGGAVEVFSFSAPGTKYSTNKWMTITSIDVVTKPIVVTRDGLAIEIKEQYSMTYPDGNTYYPVIRYAYQTQYGISLQGDGSDVVSDPNSFFAASFVGNLLEINSPASVQGIYEIIEKIDSTTIRLDSATGSAFTDGSYGIYDISIGRSGFQNGFFFLQEVGFTNEPFPIPEGYYEFDFAAYLEVPFDPIDQMAFIGTDFQGEHPANGVIDEFRILSRQLTDTRVGETIGTNEESITTGYNALRPFRKGSTTLVLFHFETLPPVNDSDYYTFANREYIQSGNSVNSRFGHSIVIRDKGLSFENKSRVNTRSEGMISFWVSPRYDTYNDPVPRVYFDANSSVVEDLTSLTKRTVKISGRASEIVSVRLLDDPGDGINYFTGGTLEDDAQTVSLKQSLPNQRTPVSVCYIPTGLEGDRLTILKDNDGFIIFNVRAGGDDFQVRQPVFWPRDTWHRIRVSWKFNRPDNHDEIRLFVDGEEKGVVLFGSGLLFGEGAIFGQSFAGVSNQILTGNIDFLDPVTRFSIGMDYAGAYGAQARIDNVKISNESVMPLTIAGQPMDVYYNTNPDVIFPEIEDAFTTFLMDFERLVQKIDDFAILRDPEFGIFNFTLNIIDSFRIVVDDQRITDLVEAMIEALKPAHSIAEINYVT
jgi:hypothetical protein